MIILLSILGGLLIALYVLMSLIQLLLIKYPEKLEHFMTAREVRDARDKHLRESFFTENFSKKKVAKLLGVNIAAAVILSIWFPNAALALLLGLGMQGFALIHVLEENKNG